MIFKDIKEGRIRKAINKSLNKRVVQPHSSKVKSLAILTNGDVFKDWDEFNAIAKQLNCDSCHVLSYTNETKKVEVTNAIYHRKAFAFLGGVKAQSLKDFIDQDFDVLVSLYSEPNIYLEAVTAFSKSKFKVGILKEDERLNDLIISTPSFSIKVFTTELVKYLTILKKL